jgi:hypothetical protein
MRNYLAYIACFELRQCRLGAQGLQKTFDLPIGVRVKDGALDG